MSPDLPIARAPLSVRPNNVTRFVLLVSLPDFLVYSCLLRIGGEKEERVTMEVTDEMIKTMEVGLAFRDYVRTSIHFS
jgi:hypothetical protein